MAIKLEPSNSVASIKLSNVEGLQLPQGKVLAAQVLESLQLSQANAMDLLAKKVLPQKLTEQLLARLQQFESNPNQRNSPLATLAKLQIQNLAKPLANWVLTEQPLAKGQALQVQLVKGELVLKLPNIVSDKRPETSSTTKLDTPNPIQRHSAANLAYGANAGNSANTTKVNADNVLISQTLKSVMPKQDIALGFLRSLASLTSNGNIERLIPSNTPAPIVKKMLAVIESLNTWQKNIPSLVRLKPENIAKAFNESGMLLEPKLKQHTQAETQPFRQEQGPDSKQKLNLDTDTKALLLRLIDLIQSFSLAPAQNTQNSKLLDALVRILIPQLPAQTAANLQNTQQELAKLEQSLQAALAKISTNQLQSILNTRAENGPNLWMATDVLLRQDHAFIPLHVYIQERRHEHKQSEKEAKKRARQWHIFLQWELEKYGKFHAELSVSEAETHNNQTLSGKIWIENSSVKERFKKRIRTLQERFADKHIQFQRFEFSEEPLRVPSIKPSTQIIDVST